VFVLLGAKVLIFPHYRNSLYTLIVSHKFVMPSVNAMKLRENVLLILCHMSKLPNVNHPLSDKKRAFIWKYITKFLPLQRKELKNETI